MSTQKYIWLWLWRGRAPHDIRKWLSKRAAQLAFALQTTELLLEERPCEFTFAKMHRRLLFEQFRNLVGIFDKDDVFHCFACSKRIMIANVCDSCGIRKDHYVMFLSQYNNKTQKMEWKYVVSKTPRLTPLP
jgi:hypothetical protein